MNYEPMQVYNNVPTQKFAKHSENNDFQNFNERPRISHFDKFAELIDSNNQEDNLKNELKLKASRQMFSRNSSNSYKLGSLVWREEPETTYTYDSRGSLVNLQRSGNAYHNKSVIVYEDQTRQFRFNRMVRSQQ